MASLAVSDECKVHSAPNEPTSGEVQQGVGQSPGNLESLSDESLRTYEAECFHQFQAATTKGQQHDCVHEMARCIVEMTNRGMSLNGGK